jgi:hypothetical protein
VQSEYKDLAHFFGALDKLDKSVVTVREFRVIRKPDILPKVLTEIVVEVHLNEGEQG